VSGPAAGLTVIVAAGIHTQGSFESFLVAVLLSGVFQIIFGLLKGGEFSSFIPTTVIKGMLAAIGFTIILKQFPHILGGMPKFESEVSFWSLEGRNEALEGIRNAIAGIEIAAVVISVISIGLLFYWEKSKATGKKIYSLIPGPLVVVILGVLLNKVFSIHSQIGLTAENGHLVQLPEIFGFGGLIQELKLPNFNALLSYKTFTLALVIAIVGSVETLLCIESSDKQDSEHRISNTNQELIAQGVGNFFSGLLGGLPMTSVIVRSSANIYAGAKTRLACIVHGLCLLVSVLFFATVLNLIPLASLAAILIVVGYKLTHPSLFLKVYKEGFNQFLPFAITFLAILFTDLLKGTVIGFAVSSLFILWGSFYSAIQVASHDEYFLVRFTKDVTFIHKATLKRVLLSIPENSKLIIDGSRAHFIDHDIYSTLEDYSWVATAKNIQIEKIQVNDKAFPEILKRNRIDGIIQKITFRQPIMGKRKNPA
jgi:MFS superfamily sulfate permease-like transporter